MFVAEAPGADEEEVGKPLIGKAGKLFNSVLKSAGIKRSQCYITNVFRYRPENNKVDRFFAKKDSGQSLSSMYTHKYKSAFLKKAFAKELRALHKTIERVRPRVVVVMGATACWAVLGHDSISRAIHTKQGTEAVVLPGRKKRLNIRVLPTYHPAYALPGRNPSSKAHMEDTFAYAVLLAKITKGKKNG